MPLYIFEKEKETARRLSKPILVIYNSEEMKNNDDRKNEIKITYDKL